MRHRKKINHLGRKSQHRQAMLSNMASSLILHKRIFTTVAKAKALRVYVEPLITKSKEDSTHSRRTVFAYLQNKHAVSELFREVSQKIASRPGGYTRILKTGFRPGDAAEMCFIELVDYNTNMLKTTEDSAKRTRRSRRGKKSTDASPKAAAPKTEEKPVDEVAEKAEEIKEAKDVDVTDASPEQVDAAEVKAEDTKDVEGKPETKEEEKEEPKAEKKEEPKAVEKKEESKVDEKEEPKAEAKDDSKTEDDESVDDAKKKDDK
jgi:large subunit ribosomal protein L17